MTILLPRHKRAGTSIGEGFASGFQGGMESAEKEKIKRLQGETEEKNFEKRQRLISQLEGEREKQKHGFNLESLKKKNDLSSIDDQKSFDIISEKYGEDAAELYKAATEGGKTNIIHHLLENEQRSQGLNQKLGNQEAINKPEIKALDYDKGLTPKERVARQEHRYKQNLPLYQATQEKTSALEHERDSLNTLEELSPNIGGWQRLNINPQTGSLIIPALASPEAQRFVKTVNDFTVNAKDSFGARVTNFELDRFMQRLPTLANSVEGREQIIKQMKIINEMNLLRNQTLKDVIEEHGGIRNIDYDEAERQADKIIKPQMAELKSEFRKIDNGMNKEYSSVIDKKRKDLVPAGRVMVEKEGKQYSVPKNKLKKALSQGYKAI